MVILLNSSSSKAYNVSVALSVGDTHEFTVKKMTSTQTLNGTDKSIPFSGNYKEGSKVKTEITGFTDGNYGTTYANYTESVDGGAATPTSSEIDSWQVLIFFAILPGYYLSQFETGQVDLSDVPLSASTDTTGNGIPMFATNNEDTYVNFGSNITSQSATTTIQNNVTSVASENNVDTAANTYHLKLVDHEVRVGSIEGSIANYDTTFSLLINVDYGRSIVTEMSLSMNMKITAGGGSLNVNLNIDIVEGSGSSGGLPISLPVSPIAIFFGMLSAVIVSRRIRKLN